MVRRKFLFHGGSQIPGDKKVKLKELFAKWKDGIDYQIGRAEMAERGEEHLRQRFREQELEKQQNDA